MQEIGSADIREPVLEVDGLVKRFGDRVVVDGLTFAAGRGEVLALLGPNGAGKTTTVETLAGFHAPDAGRVRVLGEDPRRGGPELRARIGMMLQEGGIYPGLRPPEVLRLFAGYYAAPRDPEELLAAVGLDGVRRTPYRRLSGGEKQRLSLAAALIGRPQVLFLDEPTAGMDPQARQATWALIRTEQQHGVSILLTTHFLDEAERLADRVAIINQGRLLALDTPAALRAATAGESCTLRLRAARPIAPSALAGLRMVSRVEPDGTDALLIDLVRPADALVELTTWARDNGVTLTELTIGDRTLEDVFMRLVDRAGQTDTPARTGGRV